MAISGASGQTVELRSTGWLAGGRISEAWFVGDGGGLVAGRASNADYTEAHGFGWTAAEGIVDLGSLWTRFDTRVHAVSAGRAVIVGTVANGPREDDFTGFLWTPADGLRGLGGRLAPYAVSDDGRVIVGYDGSRVQRWTADVGWEDLGLDAEEDNPVSAGVDGSVIWGCTGAMGRERAVYRWTRETGVVMMAVIARWSEGVSFQAVVGDGVVVGSNLDLGHPRAFRWRPTDGLRIFDGPGTLTRATSATRDGGVVLGMYYDPARGWRACRWSDRDGWSDLADVAAAAGVDFGGWNLNYASAMDSDGRTVVGFASRPPGSTQGFVLRFSCPADFNADGFVDFFDYAAFVEGFEAGDTDFNRDGFVDFFDYSDFVTAFEDGC